MAVQASTPGVMVVEPGGKVTPFWELDVAVPPDMGRPPTCHTYVTPPYTYVTSNDIVLPENVPVTVPEAGGASLLAVPLNVVPGFAYWMLSVQVWVPLYTSTTWSTLVHCCDPEGPAASVAGTANASAATAKAANRAKRFTCNPLP